MITPSQKYYYDINLMVMWDEKEQSYRGYQGTFHRPDIRPASLEYFFIPGITWPLRAANMSAQIFPEGSVFSARSQCLFAPKEKLPYYLGLLNSSIFDYIFKLCLGRFSFPEFIVGTLRILPKPITQSLELTSCLSETAFRCAVLVRSRLLWVETTHYYACPGSMYFLAPSLKIGFDKYLTIFLEQKITLNSLQNEIDQVARKLYDVEENFSDQISQDDKHQGHNEQFIDQDIGVLDDDDGEATLTLLGEIISFVSWCVGSCFGQWDVRFISDVTLVVELSSPFAPVPVCPPGMLVGPDGLPAEPGRIASEAWLRARPDANSLPTLTPAPSPSKEEGMGQMVEWKGVLHPAAISDSEYPLAIQWDGILVDDPGLDGKTPHPADIVRRVEEALRLLWPETSADIAVEACQILGMKDLREYFRKPGGFFADHLKRYSKSRRQAPIYWPLSTASGSYTLWIYYHRLSADLLYTAVNRYVEPKIAQVERAANQAAERLNAPLGGALKGKGGDLREVHDTLRARLSELRAFRDELLRIAALPYQPDLNDGVLLNAAPFYKLFRLGKWAKDCEAAWKKLEQGEYDWAHIAYVLWPDRVRQKCRTDKSLAIAHGLEELYTPPPGGKKKGKKREAVEQEEMEI